MTCITTNMLRKTVFLYPPGKQITGPGVRCRRCVPGAASRTPPSQPLPASPSQSLAVEPAAAGVIAASPFKFPSMHFTACLGPKAKPCRRTQSQPRQIHEQRRQGARAHPASGCPLLLASGHAAGAVMIHPASRWTAVVSRQPHRARYPAAAARDTARARAASP